MTDQEKKRMGELVTLLDEAARAYYQENREIMPNLEYDRLYDELAALEKETGIVMAKSPTLRPGYEVVSELPKQEHALPMLSLEKTKEVPALQSFLGEQRGLLSWKLDGLTVVLTYEGGVLSQAVTRGNGLIGEVVTANARQFTNLPGRIPYEGRLTLRGEAVISYPDFARLNETVEEEGSRYKNPRNLAAGSVRQLNSAVTAVRSVRFEAFALVETQPAVDFSDSHEREFQWLNNQGFETVPYRVVTVRTLPEAVRTFSEEVRGYELPSDGLVLLMDGISYGKSLGATSKSPRNAMAFKWKDETAETTLRRIEWSPSRTGLLNPVAVFDPVELEGTTVSRASVHNLSILRALRLGEGDRILVYKANMIIPQIAENLTQSGTFLPPGFCPVCGKPTEISANADVEVLLCPNPDCAIKKLKLFELFVSRNAMNIDGLSIATIEKLVDEGMVRSYADLYHLDRYRERIAAMEGFGEKSCENLLQSIDRSRHTTLPALLYALSIPGIGVANAKILAKAFDYRLDGLRSAGTEELTAIGGIGDVMADDITAWFADPKNREALDTLLPELAIEVPARQEESPITGKTFVITGAVRHFDNREALKAWLEERGAKVTGSVSKKTDFLVNNDSTSSSSKNKKAKELGIPILTEDELLERFAGGQKDEEGWSRD